MMKKNYNMKKTISIKQFIFEFGQNFSSHTKQRLLELGKRCILTRKDNSHILDLKHIEHIKYDSCSNSESDGSLSKKEYTYGQFIVNEGVLYFSENYLENNDVIQIPTVKDIYSALASEEIEIEAGITAKLLDDENIDYVIDSILKVCPEVSAEHMAIIAKYSNLDAPKGKTARK